MPAVKTPEPAISGLQRFTSTFLPYVLLAFGLVQYIYTQEVSKNQSVFIEIRDEQKKAIAAMVDVLKKLTQHDGKIERMEKDIDKGVAKDAELEKRINEIEKTVILSNGNRR